MVRHSCEKCSAHLCEDCYSIKTKVHRNLGRDLLSKLAAACPGKRSRSCPAPSKAEPDVQAVCAGTFAAWLTPLNDFAVNPAAVAKIQSAFRNHGISPQDAIAALPGELEKYGTAATDAFLRGGDKVGKDWSHIKSQFHHGTVNKGRGKAVMTTVEKFLHA